MTQQSTQPNDLVPAESDTILDTERLAADLFEKMASAQLDLLRARAARDRLRISRIVGSDFTPWWAAISRDHGQCDA